jgi:elongation factor P hydroxylase
VSLEHVAEQTTDWLFIIDDQYPFEVEKRLLAGTIEEQRHG